MVYLKMPIVVRLTGTSFATNVTGKWPCIAVCSHMVGKIIVTMEGLVANSACKVLSFFMFSHVTNAIILTNKLATTMVACIWSNTSMRVHVRGVILFSNKCSLAEGTLKGSRRAACMNPTMQLQIPLGSKIFATNVAGKTLRRAVHL